jgi:peptide deformylase
MAVKIVAEGSPVLRGKAKPVPKKDIGSKNLNLLIGRMKEALKQEEFGVAIAAPQIGEALRIFVVAGKVFEPSDAGDVEKPVDGESKESTEPDRVFINPEITRRSRKKLEMSEGCLSVPGKYGTVMRHERVSLNALTERGEVVSYNTSSLLGHIFQHECDHLDGVLYIDKTVKLEEDEDLRSARRKLKAKHLV